MPLGLQIPYNYVEIHSQMNVKSVNFSHFKIYEEKQNVSQESARQTLKITTHSDPNPRITVGDLTS
jgi:hypothetical protein